MEAHRSKLSVDRLPRPRASERSDNSRGQPIRDAKSRNWLSRHTDGWTG
jgi:hypothetical protein